MANANDKSEPAPRWVKVFGALAILGIIVFIAIHLLGGGFHGHH